MTTQATAAPYSEEACVRIVKLCRLKETDLARSARFRAMRRAREIRELFAEAQLLARISHHRICGARFRIGAKA